MSLSPDSTGASPSVGVAEVAWQEGRYRETTASAGATTERGIQGGKAYYVDEDGFTRVVSEPVLSELLTRSYFWRRAWLFGDRERARLSLGPADAASVSIRLSPTGGAFPLTLSFSRRDGRLVAVRSPRFDLDFASPTRFRETSGRRPPVRAEITWVGLPTGPMPDAAVGGGCGRFAGVPAPLGFSRTPDGGIAFPAAVNGVPVTLAIDSAADGPLRVSPEVAARLGLSFAKDVFGRQVASGARLDAGGFSCEGIHVEALSSAPDGADGVAGGTLFRETVVEIDPKRGRLAFHEPNRFVPPEEFTRVLVDDDGNRPVTVLRRRGEDVRLRLASPTGGAHLRLAPEAADRVGVNLPATVSGFRWAGIALPELSAVRETGASAPAWGDDGTFGFPALLRFHVFLDMTYRWIYVRPTEK
ncbi:MAG: retropepsin-like domain-containing protein [Acidobacteriota bacterium]|nr:retropepsin-like domain-containing protein [Acidobacteriota bacterium]MDQ5872739.1 retropepsin-like domain-containing protein [Acidobacteriota bacterium]